MCFFTFRQHGASIQGLMAADEQQVSRPMIKWAQALPRETIVLVQGIVQKPVEPIKSTTVSDAEIKIQKVPFPPVFLHNDECLYLTERRCMSSLV
jgi:aspartyl/asparaginyl-tRNA synthetase